MFAILVDEITLKVSQNHRKLKTISYHFLRIVCSSLVSIVHHFGHSKALFIVQDSRAMSFSSGIRQLKLLCHMSLSAFNVLF